MAEAITPSVVTLQLRNQWLHSLKSSNRFKLIQVHCSVALSNSQLCEYRKLAACHWLCFQLQFEAHLYCCAWVLCKAESLFELSFECLLENPLSFCILPCISAFSGTLSVTILYRMRTTAAIVYPTKLLQVSCQYMTLCTVTVLIPNIDVAWFWNC